jgi:predicted MPP superfamily phosphohydrolase
MWCRRAAPRLASELLLSTLATACSAVLVAAWLGPSHVSFKRPLSIRRRSVAFVLCASATTFHLVRHYVRARLLRDTGLLQSTPARAVYYAVCACCFLGSCSFVVQYFFAYAQHDARGDPPAALMHMSRMLGFVWVLILALSSLDVLSWLASCMYSNRYRLIGKEVSGAPATAATVAAAVKGNDNQAAARRFNQGVMRARAAIGVFWAVLVAVVGSMVALEDPIVNSVDVIIPHLPKDAEGFRIVHLSDLHIGVSVGRSRMRRTIRLANEVCGDACGAFVLTGDVVDADPDAVGLAINVLEELSDNAEAKLYVTGNHEHIHGEVEKVVDRLAELGIHHLENDKVRLRDGGIVIAGVYDINAPRMTPHLAPDMARALRGATSQRHLSSENRVPSAESQEEPLLSEQSSSLTMAKSQSITKSRPAVVLLAHQPNHFNEAASFNFVDLVLSGHTHAGQFFPATLGAWLLNTKFSGFYPSSPGKPAIYVSAGTHFFGPPIRFTTHHHEITCLTLKSGNNIL